MLTKTPHCNTPVPVDAPHPAGTIAPLSAPPSGLLLTILPLPLLRLCAH